MQLCDVLARQGCKHDVSSIRHCVPHVSLVRTCQRCYSARRASTGTSSTRAHQAQRPWLVAGCHSMAQHVGVCSGVAAVVTAGTAPLQMGHMLQEPAADSVARAMQPAVTCATDHGSDMELLQLSCKGSLTAHLSGNNSSEVQPGSIAVVQAALHAALRASEGLAKRTPAVYNVARLTRRIRSDLNFLERCIAHQQQQHQGQVTQNEQQQQQGQVTQQDQEQAVQQVQAQLQGGLPLQWNKGQQPQLQQEETQQQDEHQHRQVTNNTHSGQHTRQAAPANGAGLHAPVISVDQHTSDTLQTSNTTVDGQEATQRPQLGSMNGKLQDGSTHASMDNGEEPTTQPLHEDVQLHAQRKRATRLARALTVERVQGLINNLRGYSGELLAAQTVPGLMAVCKKVHAVPCSSPPAPGSAHEAQVAARSRQQAAQKRKQQEKTAGVEGRKATAVGMESVAEQQGISFEEELHSMAEQTSGMDAAATGDSKPTAAIGEGKPSARIHSQSHVSIAEIESGVRQPLSPVARSTEHATDKQGGSIDDFDLTVNAEVDIVCQHGSVWLEVKNQEPFGLDSEHWHGTKGSMKGLKRQVQELLQLAAAPCNAVRWEAPLVAVLFPCGADPEVVTALQDMGAAVIQNLDSLPTCLPPRPPEPMITNLDTTTMCALVSQVSWAAPGDPVVAQWAARTSQWRQCVAEEEQNPLLPQLNHYLAPGRRLVAADVAVRQFETLVAGFAGPQEKARWAELRDRLEVIPTQPQTSQLSQRVLGLGELREVGQQQVAVFGVGDALRAITLTANGAAIRSAEQQGVCLEAVVHRAVWLAGM